VKNYEKTSPKTNPLMGQDPGDAARGPEDTGDRRPTSDFKKYQAFKKAIGSMDFCGESRSFLLGYYGITISKTLKNHIN